ncbi:glycosyl hydrolase family 28-related protein [Pseudoprimorskyibacter insulae]|uniref:Rhamnogalacturonase A/B/Epimerase-like pectate lyase domain-containing protein n=1 Tax=Pseudoprimorskyibacter insulae TaxID=1695997 RepID=A0A2R8AQ90_9RHOB|nr:glycosyl hydrolase family 28-related protein [Pseudoprimorskyibacter insulae]SPF78246.1 hypothetical protein PRI8871_00839 [Pseudoprimorskyibacter insulae]
MNKAISEGVVFMPPAFSFGLGQWSSGDGTPGSDTYANNGNAALVPSDGDFGGCLELVKTQSTQKLRYMGETPMLPGCYLQITARVKAVSGPLPSVRIAGWAGKSGGAHVSGLVEAGPSTALTGYGEVVEVKAIVGPGARTGVNLPWGTEPVYGHFGLDLTGATGGVVRIDDLVIEDITHAFHRKMMDWVDVRDFGAAGNGVTDDSAAFEAADAAADGRDILVPAGVYRLNSSVTLDNRVRFEGTLSMPDSAVLALTKSFELPTYIDAFGDEEQAFRKAFQALLNNADHESLDLGGRRISVTGPIDMQAAVNNRTEFAQRRVIRNGQLRAEDTGNWTPDVVTSQASYSANTQYRLKNVTNVANIPVGSLVTGAGVGREVYVRARNIAAQELTLSQPLYDAEGTQTYTFTRFKYILDFSGFDKLQDFELSNIELQCNELASGVMLGKSGLIMHVRDVVFNRPGHRGLTSIGEGCAGMLVDRCKFISKENGELVQNRHTIALNANSNDVKLRNNRVTQFRHFAVLSGGYQMIIGNHFFQGDSSSNGVRTAGIVLASRACNVTISHNYVDNCFVEWTNERETSPDFTGGFAFSGLTINSNVFLCSHVASWFAFVVVKPYGSGQYVNGLNVSGNTFRSVGGSIDRIERVDTSFAGLDMGKMRNIDFAGNTFQNVTRGTQNPLTLTHVQSSVASTWQIGTDAHLPFDGYLQKVESFAPTDAIKNSSNVKQWDMPYVRPEQGSNKNEVHVAWPSSVKGEVTLTVRCDD